jgi:hypothetical protein
MIGKGRSDVKHELSSVFLAIRADVSIICLTFFFFHTGLTNDYPGAPAARCRAGTTLIAMRSFTVLQICSHIPHPTQRS